VIAPLDDSVSKQLEETPAAGPSRNQDEAPLRTSGSGEEAATPPETDPPVDAPPETPLADELPEEFELTPEIIEDEALRNDFMLRLAVVLLAVLLACTEIGETTTLVHIKTGQYLTSHGILPPRTDVFTDTAAQAPWINLSWLFDLFSAATFAVGGAVGLTLVKSLLGGLTFFLLLKSVKRDMPTWWASICAGLALIVCAEQFTFEPQLITLLGISLTLWILLRWQQADGPATLWGLVPVFLVWSNMDSRAYLGLIVLMLLTLGEVLGLFIGRSFLAEESKRPQLWIIVPVSLVVFLIHPFGWQTLFSPAYLYGTVYPAYRDLLPNASPGSLGSFLPLTDPTFWRNLTLPVITALVLAATVPITFALNWRNVTPAHVLLYLGMVGIALANSYDLAAASLVFAVLAALNAQVWYAESFRQSYSIELSERVFSVGGRAVTALAFFGLAFLAISGRLLGGDANRLGFGFRDSLASLISELEKDLEETRIPGQGLNFGMSHGDALIWLNQKPFIDSRIALFARGGEESLLADFRRIVNTWAIQPGEEETQVEFDNRIRELFELRQQKLDDYKIAHAVIPLGPRVAQYGRLRSFYADSGQWQLVRLGSMAGWFYRLTPDAQEDQAYLEQHVVDFLDEAFQTPVEGVEYHAVLATAPAWTDQLFLLNANKTNSPETQQALHHRFLLHDRLNLLAEMQVRQGVISLPELFRAVSLAHLSIRHAQDALRKDPNSVMAYQALADSCLRLNALEEEASQVMGRSVQTNQERRYFQAVVAYNQAILALPGQAVLHRELGNLYNRNNRIDLALREFNKFLEITGVPDGENEDVQAEYERRLRFKKDLESQVEAVQIEIDKHLENKAPGRELAAFARQHGCILLALDLLREEGELPQDDPMVLISQLEAGQVEEAYFGFMQFEGQMDAQIRSSRVKQTFELPPNSKIRHTIALAYLSVGDYDKAIEQWTKQAEEEERRAMLNMLGTLPMVTRPVEPVGLFMELQDDWQIANWLTGVGVVRQMPHDVAGPLWNAALCHLEVGRPEKASLLLKKLLDIHPESAYRAMAAFYVGLTTEESFELDPPSMYIPVLGDMFVPGPAVAEKPGQQAESEKPEGEEPESEKPTKP
jgi:tetratricopeptide (TPR) repeat protein